MAERTTGQTISRLGVLTVLTTNMIEDFRVDKDTRRKYRKEITSILNGHGGVPVGKVTQRCMERCTVGVWN
jgi:hypothetical protein